VSLKDFAVECEFFVQSGRSPGCCGSEGRAKLVWSLPNMSKICEINVFGSFWCHKGVTPTCSTHYSRLPAHSLSR